MKNIILLLLLCTTFSATFAQPDDKLKGIDKDLEKILEATKAPGFAVAVVRGDETIYAKGFGYRDVENKIPMDENTLLAIGSSSKAFTCSVLGQLRDEDKLSFEDSPIKHIPELRFYNDDLNSNVNIRDLMTHQTGIPRHDASWYLFPTFDKDSLLQRIQYQEPFTGIRQQWYYNNFMFLTQGVIAERITGKTWEENVRERFFKPLGMERSNLSIKELEASTNIAVGYELYKDSISKKMDYYKIAAMAPAGSINSSVKEMSEWVKMWINNGKYGEEQILPEAYVKEAMSSHAVIADGIPSAETPDIFLANYGYGWMIQSYKGHYRVEHGGNIDGFSASVAFFPTDSVGIVVLANQNGSAVPNLVRNTISDRMLDVKETDWAGYFLEQKNKQKEAEEKESDEEEEKEEVGASKPSHEASAFKGNYFNPGYGRFNISAKGDSLFATFKRMKLYLKHVHYDIFEPYEVEEDGIDTSEPSPLKFNFTTNDAGEIGSLKLKVEPTLEDAIEFKHEPEIMDMEVSAMEPYVGDYDLIGMTIKVYTKEDKGLFMFVTGQPEYHLLPSEEHLFILEGLEGFKAKFEGLENEKFSTLVMIQPNGTFKGNRKE